MKLDRIHRERDAVTFGALSYTKHGVAAGNWRDLYRLALALNWKQFFCGLFAAEMLINLAFATLYSLYPGCISNSHTTSFIDLFFFSIETLATVSFGIMAPANLYGHIVSGFEIMTGMTFTAVVTGLIFIRFSKPRPRLMFAAFVVIGPIDGQETLSVRIANGHRTALSETHAALTLLWRMHDERGAVLRRLIDIKLERTVLPFFPLTWNLLHRITPDSPFYGITREALQEADAKLILTIHAHDPAIAADVRATHAYIAETILLHHRYQDAVTIDETGYTTADLTKLSLVEAVEDGIASV
jgi:inward rectifier potassium channel